MLEEYKKLVSEMGLSKKVRFFGRVLDRRVLWEIYARSKILVLPSFSEAFGIVVPEAMVHETPVVISKNVGSVILVDDWKSSIVLDDVSSDEISQALLELVENPKLLRKMGVLSRSVVKKRMEDCNWKLCSTMFGLGDDKNDRRVDTGIY